MRKLFCALLAALLPLSCLPAAAEESVYIDTADELFALSARVAGGDSLKGVSVYLTADLTLTGEFVPIGADIETPFSGAFYGGGRTISGLKVRGRSYAGLFGCVYGGTIDGITIENAEIDGDNYAGVVAGRIYACGSAAVVTGCKAQGTVRGASYAGGAVGYAGAAAYGVYSKAEVADCYFDGEVYGDIHVGGILGKGDAASTSSRAEVAVTGCTARGSVRADGRYGSLSGGVCGSLSAQSDGGSSAASVLDCVSYASASARLSAAGGICGAIGAEGYGASADLAGCFAFGSVGSAALSGGLCGKSEEKNDGLSTVRDSVAAGTVTGGGISAFSAGVGVSGCKSAADGGVSYPEGVAPPVYAAGDVNGDGVCDNADAALLLQYDAGLALLGVAAHSAGDLAGDGVCDNADAALILRYDAGLRPLARLSLKAQNAEK